MRTFFSRFFGSRGSIYGPEAVRERGRPASGNGASSLHLVWRPPATTLAAVRATVEIPQRPVTSDLYFFALQVSFAAGGRHLGGGHVGLQWNRRYPGSTAVNWGGYASQERGGAVLPGTDSPLPSQPNDPNTRDYAWQPGRRYRLTIDRGSDLGWWRGLVADLGSGAETTIRELAGGGEHLTAPLVWAEVFAACDAPSPLSDDFTESHFSGLLSPLDPGKLL